MILCHTMVVLLGAGDPEAHIVARELRPGYLPVYVAGKITVSAPFLRGSDRPKPPTGGYGERR